MRHGFRQPRRSEGECGITTRRTSQPAAIAKDATPDETSARRSVVAACRRMNALGINQGTSGNISVRHGARMLITPSATQYEDLRPDMIAAMAIDGDDVGWDGTLKPSTEWRFHRDILRARPEIGAVVHAHPIFCTTLAMARKDIPAAHYMMAAFGGMNIRCAPYATFGTPELSAHAVAALEGRAACLLANHGMIACAPTLARALWLAAELETLARQFFHTLLIGGPVLLTPDEIAAAREKFSSYGLKQDFSPPLAQASGGAGAPPREQPAGHADAASPSREGRGAERLA